MMIAIFALLAAVTAPALGAPTVTLTDNAILLQNDHVRRGIVRDGSVARTAMISRADGTDEAALVSDEFLIRLMDGSVLTVADFRVAADPITRGTEEQASAQIVYAPAAALPPGAPLSVTVTYTLGDEPYLRKTITLVMPEGGAVDRLEVERFATSLPCDLGGRGEPVFLGESWFAGLEYPGSETSHENGVVALAHFPGLAKQDEETGQYVIQSKTAVIGTGVAGDPPALAFSDYVDTIRQPVRNFLQYNSWYDWRGDQLTRENLMGTFEGFKENLLDPYALMMHAFVPDDGWQDKNSIWMPKENLYPEGFGQLAADLEARGSRLGIWMPLNGTNLNADWGAEQGYEKSDRGRFYCLVGPKYNAAIREATKRIITQGNLSYYKHDFNSLRCTAEGHGHLPDNRHGHEANLDAELELLAYEREVQPGIFLNVTSSVWLSPWWLMHADSIWMCASDFGYDKTYPQLSPREWAMSYRDCHFYNVYEHQRRLVPISAMMTHGIIHGKRAKLGGNQETLREWSDYVVMYYGRGVQLKELYVSPEILDADWWKVLGEATRWAVENCEVLENVVMVGGAPREGEAYGYAHWEGDRGILCVRNPAPESQEIRVPFDKSVRYRGAEGRAFQGRVIYPFVADLPERFTSGEEMALDVPGCSVMLLEFSPGSAEAPERVARRPKPIRTGVLRSGDMSRGFRISVPDEDMARCDLYWILRGQGQALDLASLTVNGEPAASRLSKGDDWVLRVVDLRPFAGEDVEIVGTVRGAAQRAFGNPDVLLSAWIIADRAVAASDPPPGEHLPFAIGQDCRRQTIELLPETEVRDESLVRHITEEDLASIKAAKLRIRVFDVNRDEQYSGKFIYLNGENLAPIPANTGTLSAWQEQFVDLQPEQLGLVGMSNRIELDNAGGDCYKFTGLALAVQLADGTWVASRSDRTVRSSVPGWAHTEGEVFEEGKSGEITLRFE